MCLFGGFAALVCAVLLTAGSASATVSGLTYNSPAHLSVSNTAATVTGSVTCDPITDVGVYVSVDIVQGKGSTFTQAIGNSGQMVCTGSSQSWSVVASTIQGQTLHTGKATVFVGASGATSSSNQEVGGTIRLTH
jgi:hypothetical protein